MRIEAWKRMVCDPPKEGMVMVAEVVDVDGEMAGWAVASRSEDCSWRVGFSTNLGDDVEVVDIYSLADGLESLDAAQVALDLWAHRLEISESVVV